MSKTIGVLDNGVSRKQIQRMDIQDEIAKTYFHVPAKKHVKKKNKWKQHMPWAITAIALLVAVAAVIFKSSIDIKVRFLGEIPSVRMPVGLYHSEKDFDKGAFLVEGGEPNREIVKNAYFAGDAKNFSMAKPEELVLCNARGPGWANYTIELKEPVDLNKLDIRYMAKGVKGDEFLALIISDENNRIYRLEKDLSSSLSKDWRGYRINFRRIKKAVDLSNIAMIKFEFGRLTAGNYPSAIVFLKDIYVTKARRFKWL